MWDYTNAIYFGGRVGYERAEPGHVFSWGSIMATVVVGGTVGAEDLEPEPGASQGFHLAQCGCSPTGGQGRA